MGPFPNGRTPWLIYNKMDINGGDPNYHEPPKPTCLEVSMVNNLVFRWPKPLFFMVLGAHGTY